MDYLRYLVKVQLFKYSISLIVNWAHPFYTQRFTHYIVPASVETSSSTLRATIVILDTGSKYYIICHSGLLMG